MLTTPDDREVERVRAATSGWIIVHTAVTAERDGYRVHHGCVDQGRLYDSRNDALADLERLRALAAIAAAQVDYRELAADAYKWRSGKSVHASDCATSNAPAMEPCPCDCAAMQPAGGEGVRKGWRLVPIEPTPAMLDAFVSRALQVSIHGEGSWSNYGRNQWLQMIAAAPSPGSGGEGDR